MCVTGSDFRVSMTQGILDYAEVFGLLVEIGATAMTEDVTGLARLLEAGYLQCLVHDIAQAIAGNASQFIVVGIRQNKGGEGTLLFYWLIRRNGIYVSFEDIESLRAGINGIQTPGSTLAPNHDDLDVPADILAA